jgi:hypothetical protein
MAVLMLQHMREGTPELYDAVAAKLGVQDDPPAGLVVHTAVALDGGGMRICDVWESAEAYQRFREERLMPAVRSAMQEHGMPEPDAPPEQEINEIHDLVVP